MSYETYVNHISAYEREFKTWETRVEKIIKRYRDDSRDDRATGAKFNVLWSNVQTLKAATFARLPLPDVSRRFKDNDPVGRVAAEILERALTFQVEHFSDFAQSLKQCIYDRFLGGRGVSWVRYEAKFSGQVTEDEPTDTEVGQEIESENAPVDYVHWKDFGHAVTRTWEECGLVWRKVYLTRKEADARFPDVTLPLDTMPDDQLNKQSKTENVNNRALVYELWDKEEGKAVWLSKSIGKIIDEKEDPLGLEEFFPCPRPLFATLTSETLVPLPDYSLYQDQAAELDTLSDRIDGLIKALQIKGVYDASQPELERLFTESENGSLIPVKNWAGFAEKSGLKGSIDIVEILPIAQALREAYGAFDQVKGQIYELTGISDILRGETAPSETATAQQIKNSYASLRLKVYQDEVEKFATHLLQLKAQIICNHFDPLSILKLAAADQLSDEDKQHIPQAMEMLKGGVMSSFRIEIATDSMVYQDELQEKQDRLEFLNSTSGFLKLIAEVGQISPGLVPMGVELMKFGITAFRVGKNLEGTMDHAIEQLKQKAAQDAAQPKPNPDAIKAQAAGQVAQVNAQAKSQIVQVQEQGETQRAQADQASKERMHAMDQAHEAQMAAIQAQHDREREDRETQANLRMDAMQRAADAQASRTEQMFQVLLQRMKGATAVEVAEIGKETTLDAAQISAAQSAEE